MAVSTQGVPELQNPDLALVEGIDMKPFGKSAANEIIVTQCSMMLTLWCSTMRAAIKHKRGIFTEVRRLHVQCCLYRSCCHASCFGRRMNDDNLGCQYKPCEVQVGGTWTIMGPSQ